MAKDKGWKFIELTDKQHEEWKMTGINSAELNGVRYSWCSPSYKGDLICGWAGEDNTFIKH